MALKTISSKELASRRNGTGKINYSNMSRSQLEALRKQRKEVNIPLKVSKGNVIGNVSYGGYMAIVSGNVEAYTPVNDEEKRTINQYINGSHIPLQLADGTNFGNVSYNAIKAIESGKVDEYKPVDEAEKEAIKKYMTEEIFSVEAGGTKYKLSYNDVKMLESGKVYDYLKDEKGDFSKKSDLRQILKEQYKANGLTDEEAHMFVLYDLNPYEFDSTDYTKWKQQHDVNYFSVFTKDIPWGSTTEQEIQAEKVLRNYTDTKRVKEISNSDNAFKSAFGNVIKYTSYGGQKVAAGLADIEKGRLYTDAVVARYILDDKEKSEKILSQTTTAEIMDSEANLYAQRVGIGKTGQYIGDLLYTAGSLVPSIVVDLVATKGSSTVSTLATAGAKFSKLRKVGNIVKNVVKPSAGSTIFMLQAAGGYSKSAYAETGDLDKSLQYGTVMGMAEGLTEKLFGGFAGTDIGDSLIDFTVKNKYFRKALNIASEGVEEAIMTGVDPFFKRVTGVDKNAKVADWKEYLQSAGGGVALSLLMGVGTYPIKNAQKQRAVEMINTTIERINPYLVDDKKLTPVTMKSSMEEIKAHQGQIKDIALVMSGELENDINTAFEVAKTVRTGTPTDRALATVGMRINSQGEVDSLIRLGLSYEKDTKAYQLAEGVKDNDGVTNSEIGQLAFEVLREYHRELGALGEEKIISEKVKLATEKLTNAAAERFKHGADIEKLYNANAEFLSSAENTVGADFVRGYIDTFVEMIKANNSTAYKSLSNDNIDIAQAIYDYITTGVIPESVTNTKAFMSVAETVKNILTEAVSASVSAHNSIYGQNAALDAQLKAIKNGDFSSVVDSDIDGAAVNEDGDNYEIDIYKILEAQGLTYEEQSAIIEYKSSGSYKINKALTEKKSLSTEQRKFKEHINSALDKFPVYTGIVFRNIGFETKEEFETFIAEHAGKTSIIYSAFTSAGKTIDSYPVEAAYKVHYEILSHNSKDVSSIGLTEENEVLFKCDTEFIVKSFTVSKNEIKISCEEFNDDKKLQTSIDETRNKNASIEHFGQSDDFTGREENPQTLDSVREGSREFYGISQEKSAGERGKVGNSDFSDSMELRKVNRNVSVAQGELERNGIEKENLSQVNPQLYKWLAIINDKSSKDNIPQKEQIVNNNGMQNSGNNTSEIVTLKKQRSIYSVFKDAEKVIIGDDCITDGKAVVPKSDTTLEAIMAVTDAQIEENDNYSLARVYNKANSVVIEGEPKVVGNDAYVFEIDGNYYACKQKHLDAFNNDKRVVKANTSEKTAWTVHDENGNLVALFMPLKTSSVTEDVYNSLPYVSEVLAKDDSTDETLTKELKNQVEDDTIKENDIDSINYSLEETDDQSDVMWTIEEGVLNKREVARFYNLLGELKRGMFFPQTVFGEYIFDIDGKLVYSDGDYLKPTIFKVITFNTQNSEVINYCKEIVINEEESGIDSDSICETLELMQGKGIVTSTDYVDSEAYRRKRNSQGKGRIGKAADRESGENVDNSYSIESEADFSQANDIENINYSLEGKGRSRKKSSSRKGKTTYNEYQTNALKWARSTGREIGDITILSANGKYFALIEATEDGFIELQKGSYKGVRAEYERIHSEKDTSFYEDIEEIRTERNTNLWDMQYAGDRENDVGDGGQTGNQGFQTDTSGNDEYLWRGNKGEYGTDRVDGIGKSDRDSSEDEVTNSYLLESEADYGEGRNLLSNGSGEWQNSKGSRKQTQRVDGRTRRYKEGRKTASERRKYCQTLKASGVVERRIVYGHKCEVIPEGHYTERMKKTVDKNSQNGIDETIFITGMAELPYVKDGNGKSKKAKGIFIKTKDGRRIVVVQYDNQYFTPEQINDHELVHEDYDSERTQKVKNIIFNTLPQKVKEEILGTIQEDYSGVLTNAEEETLEELVANILTEMHYLSDTFSELTKAYWNKDDAFISRWEYETNKKTFKRQVEKEYTQGTSGAVNMYATDINDMYDEDKIQLDTVVMREQASKQAQDGKLPKNQCSYTNNYFVLWENYEVGKYTLICAIWIENNDIIIGELRSGIKNGVIARANTVGEWTADVWSRRRSTAGNNNSSQTTGTHRSDDRLHVGPSQRNTERYIRENSGDSGIEKINERLNYEESVQLREYIMSANNSSEELRTVDCKEIGNNFYVWRNSSKTDYSILFSVPVVGNKDLTEFYRNEMIDNDGAAERIWKMYSIFNAGQGNGISGRVDAENPTADGSNGGISYGKSKRGKTDADRSGDIGESIGDQRTNTVKYSLADDGEYDLIDIWNEAVETYGAISEGEKPAREVSVPKKISEDEPVSYFARTMMEAGVTPDEALSEFEQAILDGTMSHEVITDKRALKYAQDTIKREGFDQALEDWSRDSARGKVGKKDLAVGMELYNQCVNNKDYKNAMKIAAELAAEATRAGQALQACRLLKQMSPDGQLYYLEKSVAKMNEEFKEKLGKRFEDIELDEDLMEEFFTSESEEQRNAAYDNICQNIADQIPATLQDKWNSWRYLAMLGNPRTHIRNIIGNAVFTPAIRIKNYIGAGLEKALNVEMSERTKSVTKSKEALEFAKNDFNEMVKVLQGVNAKYAVTTDIEERRQIFKTRALEKLRNKNFEFLEIEDMWFLKTHYVDVLARIITARGIDVNSIDSDTLDKVRAYAVKEAQAATYRDANVLAEGLNKLQRKAERSDNKAVRATSVLIEGVMPFKKTPLNIAKQGIQYSPVSILTGIYQLGKEVKEGTRTAAEAIDTLSKGITGTGLMILGYFLAQLGMLVGEEEEPEKKRKFDKATGEQSYSIRVGDSSYTIDWAAPLNLSLFTGTALYDVTKDGEFSFKKVVDSLATLPEPLLELSVFSGISDIITSAQYEKTNPMVPIVINMGNNFITQGLPTIGGQISRVSDPTKRDYYYEDKNSGLPSMVQNFIGKVSSKIPFVSRLFEPSVDVWGREETYGGFFERVAENFVSPGYYSQEDYNAVNKELQELYSRTGETDVLPRTQQKYYTESGVEYYMTAEQYTEAKKLRGQKSFELVEKLISSSKYKKMDDADKVKAIKKCYDTAGDYAKERVIEKVKNN